MKITVLMDDKVSSNLALKNEHGLSMWIEYDCVNFMFDFAASALSLRNAERMGIDISKADYMICSHAHYDHAGGYRDILERGLAKDLITGRNFWEPKFAKEGARLTYLGASFTEEDLKSRGISNIIVDDIYEIRKGCYAIGNFHRTHEFETIPDRFVKETKSGIVIDNFEDEICLAFNTQRGIVVLVGCSHPGILNILTTVKERLGENITAVFGGTHLVEADEARIAFTLDKMKELGVEINGFSHCSGSYVYDAMSKDMDITGCHLATGDVLIL